MFIKKAVKKKRTHSEECGFKLTAVKNEHCTHCRFLTENSVRSKIKYDQYKAMIADKERVQSCAFFMSLMKDYDAAVRNKYSLRST